MTRFAAITAAVVLATSLGGCAAEIGGPISSIERDDLSSTSFTTHIDNGLTDTLAFEIAPDTESFLIEVQGDRGLYSLVDLTTPGGRQLIEDGGFVTRSSRGNYGLANWMYPNVPDTEVEPGTYTMVIRGMANPDGGTVSEDIHVRIYEKKRPAEVGCGVELDFMVDESALALSDIEAAIERIVGETNRLLGQADIHIVNYSVVRVNLSELDVDVSQDSVLPVVDDVLAQARRQGFARDGSIHVMLVRSIGGTSEPKGRSLGLPGPFNADRPNSAILVATDLFVDLQGYLDTDGVAETLTHEMGHYLGLYHTSEISRDKHDPIADTPECTSDFCGESYEINIMSTGSPTHRYLLTEGQAKVMRNHPLCVPLSETDYVPPPEPPACTLECAAPSTCVIWGGAQRCLDACDPDLPDIDQCQSFCTTSDDGVFVCQPTSGDTGGTN